MSVESAPQAEGGAASGGAPEPAPGSSPAPGWARGTARRAWQLIAGHKVISGSVAVFAVAAIAISIATTGSGQNQPPPQPAAAFSLPALGTAGQHVSLSQYAGKPVIINFWASWCSPCQQETPLLASWYKQQHGKVILLGLDENDSAAAAEKFARAKGVTYPLGFDPNVTVAPAYGVDALPQTFFLNAKHQIVDHVIGAVTTASLDKGVALMNSAS
jgi:cytochrome c biogenesis protein CcmG, thiol:disulfide interchange protein DsbE